jgi:hypothetical protein
MKTQKTKRYMDEHETKKFVVKQERRNKEARRQLVSRSNINWR